MEISEDLWRCRKWVAAHAMSIERLIWIQQAQSPLKYVRLKALGITMTEFPSNIYTICIVFSIWTYLGPFMTLMYGYKGVCSTSICWAVGREGSISKQLVKVQVICSRSANMSDSKPYKHSSSKKITQSSCPRLCRHAKSLDYPGVRCKKKKKPERGLHSQANVWAHNFFHSRCICLFVWWTLSLWTNASVFL